MIEAYFDESGTDDNSPFLCVAGYLFEKEKAKILDYKWRKMLDKYKLPFFHMVECAHNIDNFSHLTPTQCDHAAREAIELIKKFSTRGIATALDKPDFQLIGDKQYSNSYAFMCDSVLQGVKNWADINTHYEPIAYWYEAGANGFSSFLSIIEKIQKNPALKVIEESYRIKSVSLVKKEDSPHVQCADILAWHWFTFNKRKSEGKRPLRADFKSLVSLKNVDAHRYDAETIVKWLENNKS